MNKFILSCLFLSFVFVSCSTTTSPNSGGAGVGNTFNYILSQYDTNGVQLAQDQSESTTITSTNMNYQGRSGVTAQSTSNGSGTNKVDYFSFDANGDVDQFAILATDAIGTSIKSEWMTYPFVSTSPKVYTFDSTFSDGFGGTTMINWTATLTNAGTASVTVGNQAVNAEVVSMVVHESDNSFGNRTADATDLYYYAPSLHQFVKQVIRQHVISDLTGDQTDVITTTLVSYSLK
ncbi:MAG: hypothetical protein ACHQNE_05060 [Candidatus Kapaibacterium sp.]